MSNSIHLFFGADAAPYDAGVERRQDDEASCPVAGDPGGKRRSGWTGQERGWPRSVLGARGVAPLPGPVVVYRHGVGRASALVGAGQARAPAPDLCRVLGEVPLDVVQLEPPEDRARRLPLEEELEGAPDQLDRGNPLAAELGRVAVGDPDDVVRRPLGRPDLDRERAALTRLDYQLGHRCNPTGVDTRWGRRRDPRAHVGSPSSWGRPVMFSP